MEPSRQSNQAGSSGPGKKVPDPRSFENTAGFRLAETILDRSPVLDPELHGKLPRQLQLKGRLDHEHQNPKPIVWTFLAVAAVIALMAAFTYSRYHELPVFALTATVLGMIMAACVIFTYVPPGCDCRMQKLLVAKGSAVIGQISEKHAAKQADGSQSFEMDYAFQPENSNESHWGRLKVTRDQFIEYDEGDDLTVVYLAIKGQLVSRLYRCCAFRANGSDQPPQSPASRT